jgi:hypothetical protein
MKIKTIKITPKIILLIFETQFDITSTLLRFQEHYESPEFHGKIFSLKEFKKWYAENSTHGKESGKFTYFADWSGFNIPSHIFSPFKNGDFNPLSVKEKKILKILDKVEEPYYVIGVYSHQSTAQSTLDHEMRHAMFYTNQEYKKEVLEVISKHDFSKMNIELARIGYTEEVFLDEINAFASSDDCRFEHPVPKRIKDRLLKILDKYKKIENIEDLEIPKP